MLHLLWGLLNIGLYLFFIVTCFNATKLVREKFGMLTSIVFVLGLLSFAGHSHEGSDNKDPNSNQIKTWEFISKDSVSENATFFIDIDLEKTLVSKMRLAIEYGKDKQRQLNIPVSAYFSTTGLNSGTIWKPRSINVHKTEHNDKFQYYVFGTVEWTILGATIYSQPKEYKGIALIE